MSPAAETHAPVRTHSRWLVRTLLLGASGAGLLGVSPPDNPADVAPTITADAAAHGASFDAGEFRPTPVIVATRVVTQRATRSRTVAEPKTTVPKKSRPAPSAGNWVRPSAAAITSPFGMRWGKMHAGVDFGAHDGTPIRAVGDGVVVGAGFLPNEGGYGQLTLIRHPDGFVTAYAHQSRMLVQAGQHVTAGEIIGYVGSTGHSTGPHLHFEVRTSTHGNQISPVPWLHKHGVSV